MTIVITGSCSKLVFFAIDRRMTKRKPGRSSEYDDDTNKAFIINRGNACLTIGWTGLAELAHQRNLPVTIGDWLIHILQEAEATRLPAGQTIDLIASRASKDFELSLKSIERIGYKGFHEFICSGWCHYGKVEPFAGVFAITNFRDESWNPLKDRLREFRVLYKDTYNLRYRESAASIFRSGSGMGAVSTEEISDLLKLLQTKPSNKAVAGRVGAIIRKASKHPTLGKSISEESRCWILRPDERVVEEFQWPRIKDNQVFGQIIDTPIDMDGLIIGGVWAATGEFGKVFKADHFLADVFCKLDLDSSPIKGTIECDYPECLKILKMEFDACETLTLQLEDGRKLSITLEEIETINHQKRFKVVAEGDLLLDL